MAQRTSGIWRLLSAASIYDRFQALCGDASIRRELVEKYIRAKAGDRLLDIGCGTGTILKYLPHVEYVGFDPNPRYIAAAQEKFGDRGLFFEGRVNSTTLESASSFDIVIAMGVLHHLDDDEAIRLFETADAALGDGGRLVTCDPCYGEGQSRLARLLISRDRGRSVRTVPEYRGLALRVFPDVRSVVRHNLLRIPFTHVVVECLK